MFYGGSALIYNLLLGQEKLRNCFNTSHIFFILLIHVMTKCAVKGTAQKFFSNCQTNRETRLNECFCFWGGGFLTKRCSRAKDDFQHALYMLAKKVS